VELGISAADEQAVLDWAESQSLTVSNRYPNRLVVDIEAPVSNIQHALHVQINRYNLDGMEVFSNDRDPVIPASVSAKILSVAGLNSIQVQRPHSNLAKR
jgi:subtilase family serine protease